MPQTLVQQHAVLYNKALPWAGHTAHIYSFTAREPEVAALAVPGLHPPKASCLGLQILFSSHGPFPMYVSITYLFFS